jgi:hypothetical protein
VTPEHAPAQRYLRPVAAACALGAGAVHLAVTPTHLAAATGYGLGLAAVGWLQIGWAVAVLVAPSRRLLLAGATLMTGAVAAWAVSRTAGPPFGWHGGAPEPVTRTDVTCVALELAAVLAAAGLLRPRLAGRTVRREPAAAVLGAVVLTVAAGTAVAAAPSSVAEHGQPGPAGTHQAGTGDGHPHGAGPGQPAAAGAGPARPAAGGDVLADAPAWGCADMPHQGDDGHGNGACTDAPVTAPQRAAAADLVLRSRAAMVRYPTLAAAEAAGYRPINVTGPLVHVGHLGHQTDDVVLDPERIESLVYVRFGDRSMLLGAMYIAPPGRPGPLVGGALTQWHTHTDLCLDRRQQTAVNPREGRCPAGSRVEETAEMLHVWAVPYPGGPFAELDLRATTRAVTDELARRGGLARL